MGNEDISGGYSDEKSTQNNIRNTNIKTSISNQINNNQIFLPLSQNQNKSFNHLSNNNQIKMKKLNIINKNLVNKELNNTHQIITTEEKMKIIKNRIDSSKTQIFKEVYNNLGNLNNSRDYFNKKLNECLTKEESAYLNDIKVKKYYLGLKKKFFWNINSPYNLLI